MLLLSLLLLLLLQTMVNAYSSVQRNRNTQRQVNHLVSAFGQIFIPREKDCSRNIILLLRGMSWISGCHDWLQRWQPVFISLPSVLAHARGAKSKSSSETCSSLSMCLKTTSQLSPLKKFGTARLWTGSHMLKLGKTGKFTL